MKKNFVSFSTKIKIKIKNQAEIDLNDPDVERAAQKIQSSYRGFQQNRKSKTMTTETTFEKKT